MTHNYRIYGRIKGQRGGAFFGISEDDNLPLFGGANLIHAPIWWNTTADFVQTICDKIKNEYPQCECYPERLT